jgi:3-hydroxy-9,10-secoandrosta-1,3,5(10)-triene-9,17-dione monooxygenase reductase component
MEPSGPPTEPALTFEDGVDSARFRTVLGHFATGVTVVTGHGQDGPAGLSANSFTSVSLDPPLILVCVAHTSSTWPAIRDSGRFAVNVLGEHQEDTSRRFSAKSGDRFEGVGWAPGKTGSPIFHDAIAYVDCVIDAEHEGGDHVIVVGRVVDMGQPAEGGPLLFWRGGYAQLGS